ncbi:hypothetical protein FRC03_010580 [Tulasnella sp. 419]|nr:hypothetical protein FRC02_010983 [Tulasnella sp. 418]KAG8957062.1 hypothetical protein FRC03_010580 [Tulasnella sp. 419]
MYSSFSVADLGRAQTLRNPAAGGRSLHGSQSHSNLQFSSSNFGEGFGVSSHQQTQQYLPGYLLSATQGKAPPGSPNNFNLPPLEGDNGTKRGAASVAEFGRESLLTAPRPSPKGRSPKPGPTLDENAPPTASIMDVQFNAPEPQPPKLNTRVRRLPRSILHHTKSIIVFSPLA